jgi:hypothetical protein
MRNIVRFTSALAHLFRVLRWQQPQQCCSGAALQQCCISPSPPKSFCFGKPSTLTD